MNFLRLRKSDLHTILAMMIVGAFSGGLYAWVAYLSRPDAFGSILLGIGLGALIGTGVSYVEVVFVSRPYSKLRQWPFWVSGPLRVLIHSFVILGSRFVAQTVYNLISGEKVQLIGSSQRDTITDLGFSLVLLSILVFFMQMRNFIGARTFRNLMFGRYNKPRMEERIFMIVDVVGSTQLAQKLGDVAFHKYLNRLFILMDTPIDRHGGEIHSYVGDAVFLVWPVKDDRRKNARPLKAIAVFEELFEKEATAIEREFGVTPAFRVAIHKGAVVAGETGHRKRQITYLGHTVNIASRIETLTKTADQGYLASNDYLSICEIPDTIQVQDAGEHEVKGSDDPVRLSSFTVKPQ